MAKFEDMSRDELIEHAKELKKALLRQGNKVNASACPFCYGDGLVSVIKYQVKEALVAQWHKDVTEEEWDAYVLATFGS